MRLYVHIKGDFTRSYWFPLQKGKLVKLKIREVYDVFEDTDKGISLTTKQYRYIKEHFSENKQIYFKIWGGFIIFKTNTSAIEKSLPSL